jgi:hypothetical protein
LASSATVTVSSSAAEDAQNKRKYLKKLIKNDDERDVCGEF